MATDFAGTHSERIDKLTGSHVELRTMVRVSAAAIVLLFPVTIGLVSYLVVDSFRTSAKIDVLDVRMNRVKAELKSIDERVDSMDTRLSKVETRLEAVDKRLNTIENRLDSLESRIGQVEVRLGKIETELTTIKAILTRIESKIGSDPQPIDKTPR